MDRLLEKIFVISMKVFLEILVMVEKFEIVQEILTSYLLELNNNYLSLIIQTSNYNNSSDHLTLKRYSEAIWAFDVVNLIYYANLVY
jgi:hypothetical protein